MIQITSEFQILFISRLISLALVGEEGWKYMPGNENTNKYPVGIEMPASPFQFAPHLDRQPTFLEEPYSK